MMDELRNRINTELDSEDFEVLSGVNVAYDGFNTQVTKPRGDGGFDVIGRKSNLMGGAEIRLVQVKHQTNPVHRGELKRWYEDENVQAAIRAAHKVADFVTVEWMTTTDFGEGARKWAWNQGLRLLGMDDVCRGLIQQVENRDIPGIDQLLVTEFYKQQGSLEMVGSTCDVLPVRNGTKSRVDSLGYASVEKKNLGKVVDIWAPGMFKLKESVPITKQCRVDVGTPYRDMEVWLEFTEEFTSNW